MAQNQFLTASKMGGEDGYALLTHAYQNLGIFLDIAKHLVFSI